MAQKCMKMKKKKAKRQFWHFIVWKGINNNLKRTSNRPFKFPQKDLNKNLDIRSLFA